MRTSEATAGTRPFLKWVGGKRQLLPEIERFVPERFRAYHEPFVGGGALFFRLRASRELSSAVLGDLNERLVRAYQGIRDSVDRVVELLRGYEERHSEAFFLEMRQRRIDGRPPAEVAAWLVYLNKTGYNGLYRVNSRNVFNVPFGRYARPAICDEANLRGCARALQGVELRVESFEKVLDRAKKGDFVYFDPPYQPVSRTANFRGYTQAGFDDGLQARLAEVARQLKGRGVKVLLSNSDTPEIEALYARGFQLHRVSAIRAVNSRADRRGAVSELLIT